MTSYSANKQKKLERRNAIIAKIAKGVIDKYDGFQDQLLVGFADERNHYEDGKYHIFNAAEVEKGRDEAALVLRDLQPYYAGFIIDKAQDRLFRYFLILAAVLGGLTFIFASAATFFCVAVALYAVHRVLSMFNDLITEDAVIGVITPVFVDHLGKTIPYDTPIVLHKTSEQEKMNSENSDT